MNKLLQEPEENPNRSSILRSDRSFLNTIDGKKDGNLMGYMEDSPGDGMLSSYDLKPNSVQNEQYFLRKLNKS